MNTRRPTTARRSAVASSAGAPAPGDRIDEFIDKLEELCLAREAMARIKTAGDAPNPADVALVDAYLAKRTGSDFRRFWTLRRRS